MLTLINTNRMLPLIGPIGLDYIAGAVEHAGIDVELLDLALAEDPAEAIKKYFSTQQPQLIGISFRNVDDCFWPSADWFVPGLKRTIQTIKSATDAPIVIGGVGFSVFAKSILKYTGADFGICGDGEEAIVQLIRKLQKQRKFTEVPGLVWQNEGRIYNNSPSWPDPLSIISDRDFIDNHTYFKK